MRLGLNGSLLPRTVSLFLPVIKRFLYSYELALREIRPLPPPTALGHLAATSVTFQAQQQVSRLARGLGFRVLLCDLLSP